MLLLREVTVIRWLPFGIEHLLGKGDVPADCLGDVRTGQNRLSVWKVEEDRSNVPRILAALEVGRSSKLAGDGRGYIVFDSAVVSDVTGIVPEPVTGTTLDLDANGWHVDLVGFTGRTLVDLASKVIAVGVTGTVLWKTLVAEIAKGLEEKRFCSPGKAEATMKRLRPSA